MSTVHLLDYVAGNVRSLVNAIEKLGYTVEWIESPKDIAKAEVREHSLVLDLSNTSKQRVKAQSYTYCSSIDRCFVCLVN